MTLPSHRVSRRRLVKVGGSLFPSKQLPRRLDHWYRRQAEAETVWLAGGGQLVDIVRRWDRHFELAEQALAPTVRCMQATAELLAVIRGTAPPKSAAAIEEERSSGDGPSEWVIDCWALVERLSAEERSEFRIDTWDATSDTLAALAARRLECDELVLLKSCAIDVPADDLQRLADRGIVDRVFPRAADGLPHIRVEMLEDEFGRRRTGQT